VRLAGGLYRYRSGRWVVLGTATADEQRVLAL